MFHWLRGHIPAQIPWQTRGDLCPSVCWEVPEALDACWHEICRAQPGCSYTRLRLLVLSVANFVTLGYCLWFPNGWCPHFTSRRFSLWQLLQFTRPNKLAHSFSFECTLDGIGYYAREFVATRILFNFPKNAVEHVAFGFVISWCAWVRSWGSFLPVLPSELILVKQFEQSDHVCLLHPAFLTLGWFLSRVWGNCTA